MTWPLSPSTTDVIIGGLIAALGGFLAVVWVRWRESVAERDRFQAAVLIVLDELGANEVNIEHMLAAKALTTFELYEATYRSVELILAGRLRPADRFLLAEAYAPLRARWATEKIEESMDWVALKSSSVIQPNREGLTFALGKVRSARGALATYVDIDHTTAQGVGDATTGPAGSGGKDTKQT